MKDNQPRFRITIDFFLLIPALVLCITGVMYIYSSGINSLGINTSNEYTRQIIWIIFGLLLMVLVSVFKLDFYKEWALPIMIGGALLVIASLLFGKVVNGARSWLGIGELGIQPSEFMKIAYMVFAASIFERNKANLGELRYFAINMMIMMIPVGLIILQPDFGTAMVFFPIFLSMAFFSGTKNRYILFLVLIGLFTSIFLLVPAWDKYINKKTLGIIDVLKTSGVSIVVVVAFITLIALSIFAYKKLQRPEFYWIMYGLLIISISYLVAVAALLYFKEYQILRLVVFLDPNIDPKGSGWHIIQSLTAVGSGGFAGKGFLQGTQSHYKFLPEQSTDFIFSIISEESGFIGGVVVLGSYALILGRLLFIMRVSKDIFSVSLLGGIIGLLFFHLLVNVGMTIGLMPITGIPLLFVSYGGSSMLSVMICLGLAGAINSHRFSG